MIRSVIVDDEGRAIRSMELLLEKHCPDVEVVATARNINDGYEYVQTLNPDILFLDINMPGGSGMELLEQLEDHEVGIIFTTAYQEYAIKALRLSALDYLLKPIKPEELQEAIARYQQQIMAKNYQLVREILNGGPLKKIAIHSQNGISLVDTHDIYCLSAERNYTRFVTSSDEIIASKSLREFEKLLNEYQFLRIHRSTVINLDHLKELRKGASTRVIMDNGMELEVSKNRKEHLMERLKQM